MYLFTRTSTVEMARALEAVEFATDIAAYVTKSTDLELHVWTAAYGNPGTLTWSSLVESPAAMMKTSERLLADPEYLSRIGEAAGLFTSAPDDNITQIVGAAGPPNAGASNFVAVLTAGCAVGRFAEAMAWGVDIMNYVAELTGTSIAFVRSVYGEVGTVGWVTSVDTMEELDVADAALAADPGYLERLGQTGEFFIAGSSHRILSRRLDG